MEALAATPIRANRIRAALSVAFNLAETWKWRPQHSNPCELVEKYPETKRKRFLSAAELQELGAELARREEREPYVVAALRLLIFTGARREEILGLRWDYLDLERRQMRISDHKTSGTMGEKYLPLNGPALDVLGFQQDENGMLVLNDKGVPQRRQGPLAPHPGQPLRHRGRRPEGPCQPSPPPPLAPSRDPETLGCHP